MPRSFSRNAWIASAALICAGLAACVPRPVPTPAPTPTPAPVQRPAPVATPSPVPTFTSWMDVPATPGDWSYANTYAVFGDSAAGTQLTLRCDQAARAVEISRSGTGTPGAQSMIVRTEFMERGIPAQPGRSDPASLVAQVPARDPLLDAMAFSKGRFAVEVPGLPTLYVPAWPEVSRVIEDCR